MRNLLASVAPGAVLLKNAPMLKEAPIKRGDNMHIALGFQAATAEEILKAVGPDTPEGYVAGWASTAGRDLYNHEVTGGAFQEAMDKRGLKGPMSIKLLLDHDWKAPAGVIKVLEYRRDSLWLEAQLDLEVGYVKDRWRMLKMMGGANFSVGFMLQDYEVVIREEEEDYFLRIDKGDLFEVSIVMFPGNEEAQMTFVKAALHEDNNDEDKLFFAKSKLPAWRMGASKNLPVSTIDCATWDIAAAKQRVFKAVGFDTDKPDLESVKKAFLAYDSANPTLRGSYKMLIADIIDGKMQITEGGLRAALARMPNTAIPEEVKKAANAVLDHYQEETMELAAATNTPQSQVEFEKALVARGLVKGRNEAREIARVAKTCPQIFQKKTEVIEPQQPALDAGKLTEALSLVQKMKSILAPVASDALPTVKL